jgi:hypothetical protein
VTEIVAGKPVEYHLCDTHLQDVEKLEPVGKSHGPATGFCTFVGEPGLREMLRDPEARQKVAACLLPPLCLALLDEKPEVRVVAAFQLMAFGPDAQSVSGALRDALKDSDERVRKAAEIALEYIQESQEPFWWL